MYTFTLHTSGAETRGDYAVRVIHTSQTCNELMLNVQMGMGLKGLGTHGVDTHLFGDTSFLGHMTKGNRVKGKRSGFCLQVCYDKSNKQ